MAINTYLSIITINVMELNAAIKRHMMEDGVLGTYNLPPHTTTTKLQL